jgi:hypothetical protein
MAQLKPALGRHCSHSAGAKSGYILQDKLASNACTDFFLSSETMDSDAEYQQAQLPSNSRKVVQVWRSTENIDQFCSGQYSVGVLECLWFVP